MTDSKWGAGMFAYRAVVVVALLSCGLALTPVVYGANPKASATPQKK